MKCDNSCIEEAIIHMIGGLGTNHVAFAQSRSPMNESNKSKTVTWPWHQNLQLKACRDIIIRYNSFQNTCSFYNIENEV